MSATCLSSVSLFFSAMFCYAASPILSTHIPPHPHSFHGLAISLPRLSCLARESQRRVGAVCYLSTQVQCLPSIHCRPPSRPTSLSTRHPTSDAQHEGGPRDGTRRIRITEACLPLLRRPRGLSLFSVYLPRRRPPTASTRLKRSPPAIERRSAPQHPRPQAHRFAVPNAGPAPPIHTVHRHLRICKKKRASSSGATRTGVATRRTDGQSLGWIGVGRGPGDYRALWHCIRPAILTSVLALLTGDDDDPFSPLSPHTPPTLFTRRTATRQQPSKTPASRVDALLLEEFIAGFLRGPESVWGQGLELWGQSSSQSPVRAHLQRSRPALFFGIPPPTPTGTPRSQSTDAHMASRARRHPTPTSMLCSIAWRLCLYSAWTFRVW
ncbi:hypothetical protein C8J57DRAFT_1597038 [Mycena rebaudengoi]|nr:hypothetical protein C8J57DRAFT_1597038 [Mycena rebaudengoi]